MWVLLWHAALLWDRIADTSCCLLLLLLLLLRNVVLVCHRLLRINANVHAVAVHWCSLHAWTRLLWWEMLWCWLLWRLTGAAVVNAVLSARWLRCVQAVL